MCNWNSRIGKEMWSGKKVKNKKNGSNMTKNINPHIQKS